MKHSLFALALISTSVFAFDDVIMNIKTSFDEVVFQDLKVKEMMINGGSANGLLPSGAFKGNSDAKIAARGLAIESQRQAWDIAAKAHVTQDFETAKLALNAIQWGFLPSIAGADGSWPNQDKETVTTMATIHNKSVFLYSAVRTLRLLKNIPLLGEPAIEVDQFRAGVNQVIVRAAFSANWMASSQNTKDFLANAIKLGKQTNQMFFIAVAIVEAGILAGDKELIKSGRVYVDQILPIITSEGVFPEGSGNANGYIFDSGYQTVSMELLARYISFLKPSANKDALVATLIKTTNRFLQTVRKNGRINTSKNSRTEACGAPVLGPEDSKGPSIDKFPFRVRYLAYLLGKEATYFPIADSIMAAGQGYDHIGCH